MNARSFPEGCGGILPERPAPPDGGLPRSGIGGAIGSGGIRAGIRPGVRMEPLAGKELAGRLAELAALRLAVLREFPYLYSGSSAYEERYLAALGGMPGGLILGAFDRGRLIGAATGMPLDLEFDGLRDPFARHGFDPRRVFYFGEVVVLPSHRGRGIGTALIGTGESHIRAARRFAFAAFGEIVRSVDHPRRPADYRAPADAWRRLGFRPEPEIGGALSWRDADDREETAKPMRFWVKALS